MIRMRDKVRGQEYYRNATHFKKIFTGTTYSPNHVCLSRPLHMSTCHRLLSMSTCYRPLPMSTCHRPLPLSTCHRPLPLSTCRVPCSCLPVTVPCPCLSATVPCPCRPVTSPAPVYLSRPLPLSPLERDLLRLRLRSRDLH